MESWLSVACRLGYFLLNVRLDEAKVPFTVKSVHDLTIAEPVVTVTGKAFYDIAHAPADHSNRRTSPKDYAVWEIHPVMKLEVVQ